MRTRGISDEGMKRLAKNQSKKADRNEAWDLLDKLREYMDDTAILESVLGTLSGYDALDNLQYIAQMNDIPWPVEEEEEEDDEEEDEEEDDEDYE